MALTERLALLVTANVDEAVRGLQKVETTADRSLGNAENRADRWAAGFNKAGAVMLTAGGLAAAGLWKAGEAASNLEQAVGGSTAVFGDAIDVIDDFSETSAESFGMSERAARELTSQLGAMLKGFGFTRREAAETSVSLAKLGADLSAAFGGSPEEAVAALGAALRGERDPIERYGVSLSATAVETKALQMGLAASKSELDANAKAQASLALIMEQTTDVQGQFNRESDTAAGQQARLKASLEDLTAAIGQGVLPIMSDGIGVINGLVGAFNGLPDPVQSTVSKFAVLTTGVLLAGGAASTAIGHIIKMRDNIKMMRGHLSSAAQGFKGLGGAIRGASFAAAAAGVFLLTQRLDENRNAASRYAQEIAGGFADPERQLRNVREELERLQGDAGKGIRLDLPGVSLFSDSGAREAQDNIDALEEMAADLELQLSLTADAEAEVAAQAEVASRALPTFEEAQEEVARAAEEAEKAQKRLFDAMDKVIDEAFGGLDALAAWEAGLDDIRDAARENGTSLDLSTEAGRRNHDMLTSLVRAGKDRLQNMRDQGATDAEVAGMQQILADELSDTAERLGFNAEQSLIYADALRNIPTRVLTELELRTIHNQIQRVTVGDRRVRAGGGGVRGGETYLVGERGPELFTAPGSGGIIHQTGSPMTRGAMGGGGNHYSITVNSLDPRTAQQLVVDALREYERKNGRR